MSSKEDCIFETTNKALFDASRSFRESDLASAAGLKAVLAPIRLSVNGHMTNLQLTEIPCFQRRTINTQLDTTLNPLHSAPE